ncbi:MAG: hypothetical protein JWN48_2640 [Myxococcaceae bacterium]|nr:hypothetical protein [Myxococcaceae bacterium]
MDAGGSKLDGSVKRDAGGNGGDGGKLDAGEVGRDGGAVADAGSGMDGAVAKDSSVDPAKPDASTSDAAVSDASKGDAATDAGHNDGVCTAANGPTPHGCYLSDPGNAPECPKSAPDDGAACSGLPVLSSCNYNSPDQNSGGACFCVASSFNCIYIP